MTKVKLNVFGKVQGVGFRFLTLLLAKELNINGFVRNEDEGSVYIEAMGEEASIRIFIEKIKASLGASSRVDEVIVNYDDTIVSCDSFKIM